MTGRVLIPTAEAVRLFRAAKRDPKRKKRFAAASAERAALIRAICARLDLVPGSERKRPTIDCKRRPAKVATVPAPRPRYRCEAPGCGVLLPAASRAKPCLDGLRRCGPCREDFRMEHQRLTRTAKRVAVAAGSDRHRAGTCETCGAATSRAKNTRCCRCFQAQRSASAAHLRTYWLAKYPAPVAKKRAGRAA